MANARAVQASSARAKKQAQKNTPDTKSKWVGKAKVVEPGDIVSFKSGNPSMTGNVGIVQGYLDKETVLVKTFGGADRDYGPMHISVWTREPNREQEIAGDNVGHNRWYYGFFIQEIVHQVNPKPKVKKVRKPVKFYEVTPKVLPAVLSGEHEVPAGHKVVLVDEPTVVDLHAVQQEATP